MREHFSFQIETDSIDSDYSFQLRIFVQGEEQDESRQTAYGSTQTYFRFLVLSLYTGGISTFLLSACQYHGKDSARKARHEAAHETVDTGSSRFNIMVSPSGYILAVSQHIKDHD